MPRDNPQQANARPGVNIGGRQVFSRGGIVGERPGRTSAQSRADALLAVADTASGYIDRRSAELEQEQAKAQQLQAYKDFHEDVNADVTREQAEQRAAFGDDNYARAYSRLSYSRQAKHLSEDIQQHARQMMDDSTVGIDEVESYIDATTAGAIQGIDDPDAVEVFANRLTSDAEQLKATARGVAIERQQLDGRAKLNSQIDDIAAEDLLGQPEARAMLERLGADLNVPQREVHAAMTNALIRKAGEAKDPAMLAPLFQEDDSGVSLADDPDLRSTILQARDSIQAEAEQQTSSAELTQRYELRRKVEGGGLTMGDIQSLNRDHPDWYTPDQLASMLTRSQEVAQAAAEERRETARQMSGQVSPAILADMGKSDRQRRLANVQAQFLANHDDTPEGHKAATRDYLTFLASPDGGGNIVTDTRLKDTLSAGALSRSQDGSVPNQFKRAYAVYRMTQENPELRGLTGNLFNSDAEAKMKAYDRQRAAGVAGSDNLEAAAYNAVNLDADKPVDESSLQTREAYEAIDDAVGELTDTGTLLGMIPGVRDGPGVQAGTLNNVAEMRTQMKRQARRNYRTSKDATQAAELAVDQIKGQWSAVRGSMVHKARERLPDNATGMVDAFLRAKLPQIQREMGENITLDDLAIDDARYNAAQTDPLLMSVHIGNGGTAVTLGGDDHPAPLVFTMDEARDALRAEALADANAETPSADDVEAAEPAPPPAPGSPGAMSQASAEDRRETREAIGRAVGSAASSTWQSVRDHLAEARERQQERQTQSAPGKAY